MVVQPDCVGRICYETVGDHCGNILGYMFSLMRLVVGVIRAAILVTGKCLVLSIIGPGWIVWPVEIQGTGRRACV